MLAYPYITKPAKGLLRGREMTTILFTIMAFVLIAGAAGAIVRAMKMVKETFDDLLPERMVDFTGFIDIPKS